MANSYGLSSLTWGTIPYSGFVVSASTLNTKPGVIAEVFNESGQRVASRYDDLTNEITLECIINGGTAPLPGAELTYNSIKYETLSVDYKCANKDFEKVSIKAKNSANLTLS